MRRIRQELPKEECEKILNNATAGVLSVLGDGGYPYGVPMSFVYA
jgi:nitroimidazol reductase NimA-like FMN-containing flavoprotein (pyridoxamine 5'-phosphate oxidase superfamily)